MNGSPRALSFSGLARHAVLAALAALASTIVQARTVYITPQGQTGFEADGTERANPLAYVSKSFEGLQPGDIVQLLATSRDPLVTTIFRGRVELSAIKAAQSPVTVRGLGARTRIVGGSRLSPFDVPCRGRTWPDAAARKCPVSSHSFVETSALYARKDRIC
jgi:hypothetical protein